MNNYLNNLVDMGYFPGCVCSVIKKGQISYYNAGNKSIIPNIETTNLDTLYDLASLSKVISTNTIITKLLQDNKIKLDDKVKKYLPRFQYEEITIFHLLTHTSGLPADLDWAKFKTKEEMVDYIYENIKINNIGKIIYSDIGFIILGLIIENIYNKPLDVVAQNEVFNPLHMTNTCYNPKNKDLCASTEKVNEEVIKGIVHDEKARIMNGVSGSAGVFSNVSDLTKFVNMILNDGIVDNKVFIKKEYIDLWFQILVSNNETNRSIGFLVSNGSNPCTKLSSVAIYHYGFTGTIIIIDRQRKFGIILLSNRIHPTRDNKLLNENRTEVLDSIIEIEKDCSNRLIKTNKNRNKIDK